MGYEFLTKFVRDRFAKTSWFSRGYIKDLQRLERFISRGGPKSYGEAMCYRSLTRKYPVETECIKLELDSGIYTNAREFDQKYKQYYRQLRAERKAEAQKEKARRKAEKLQERKSWLAAKRRVMAERSRV